MPEGLIVYNLNPPLPSLQEVMSFCKKTVLTMKNISGVGWAVALFRENDMIPQFLFVFVTEESL